MQARVSKQLFSIDAQSLAQAERLASELQDTQLSILEQESTEGLFDRVLSGPSTRDPINNFTSPLTELASEIPILDISTDVQDFGLLAALSTYTNNYVLALPISEEKRLPILPSLEQFRSALAFAPIGAIHIPIKEARETFFQGLSSYLAARIAGVRAGLGSKGPDSAGQWWTATTKTPGLSIYYAGTHAVREPPIYVNGLTTTTAPLSIFLPMGTLYLGADAGPNGDVIWHSSIIYVPSHTPNFATKKF